MTCKFCHDEGKKSQVSVGMTSGTLMAGPSSYYDEDGKLVRGRDPNWYTTAYSCSNGHQFSVQRREGEPDIVTLNATTQPLLVKTVQHESGAGSYTYYFEGKANDPS